MNNNTIVVSPKSIIHFIPIALCLISASMHHATGQVPPTAIQSKADFEAGTLDRFHAILAVAADNRIPLGIVRFESQSLCARSRRASYKQTPIIDVISDLLASSGYNASYQNGVLQVRPAQIPEAARRLLSMRFDNFSGPNESPQGLGIILSGYILSRLHPGEGYAGNILKNTAPERLKPFQLQNASVGDIMNYIVSQGTRGVWLASPKVEGRATAKASNEFRINIYGYKDDAKAIEQLTCNEK